MCFTKAAKTAARQETDYSGQNDKTKHPRWFRVFRVEIGLAHLKEGEGDWMTMEQLSQHRLIQTCIVVVGNKFQRQGNKAMKKYPTCLFNELHAVFFAFSS